MKKYSFIFVLLLAVLSCNAQHKPLGINYQAVARDNQGNELKNKNLSVRISIKSEDSNGIVEYAEIHSVTTDPFGLFQLVIGQGSFSEGTVSDFHDINWGGTTHFLKVEVDFGNGFISMGTMPFLAVPYALYAANAGNTDEEEDLDKDPENEFQILSLEGQILSLSDGNAITLGTDVIDDADADPQNEIQDLQVNQEHILSVSGDPTKVDLNPYLDNTDEQNLSLSGNKLTISDVNHVYVDADSVNELQSFSLTGNTLSLTQANSVNIDADPVNELQKISLNGYDLSLSQAGNTVNIKPDIIAFRAIKEGADIQNAGDTVTLVFSNEILDSGEGLVPDGYYDSDKGIFTVPAGGAGLYYFDLNYDYDTDHLLAISVNDKLIENVFDGYGGGVSGIKSYSFIYILNDGDEVEVDLILSSPAFCGKGTFFGYRIH